MSAPYGKITLTTIAEKLGWSRANLYKYVTTKEEIFLEISSDKMAAYYSSLLSAFPEGNNFSAPVIAEVWSGILNAHQDYLRYVSYLSGKACHFQEEILRLRKRFLPPPL